MSTTETPASGTLPPANWYPDPAGRHALRWWDGSRWTDRVNDADPTGPRPAPPRADEGPDPADVAHRQAEAEERARAEAQAQVTGHVAAPASTSPGAPAAADPWEAAEAEARAAVGERSGDAVPPATDATSERPEGGLESEPTGSVATGAEPTAPIPDQPVDEAHEGRPRDPLGGFDQLDARRNRRLAPEERPTTGAGMDEPIDRGRLVKMIGAAAVVVLLVAWGLYNLQSAQKWQDRGQAAEAELADRVSNFDALEDSLSEAASRGARLADSQAQMAELRDATAATVDQIRRCAGTLNELIAALGTPGEQAAIDGANRTCEAAVVNGETLTAVLDGLRQQP